MPEKLGSRQLSPAQGRGRDHSRASSDVESGLLRLSVVAPRATRLQKGDSRRLFGRECYNHGEQGQNHGAMKHASYNLHPLAMLEERCIGPNEAGTPSVQLAE